MNKVFFFKDNCWDASNKTPMLCVCCVVSLSLYQDVSEKKLKRSWVFQPQQLTGNSIAHSVCIYLCTSPVCVFTVTQTHKHTHRVGHTVGKCNPLPFMVCLRSRCPQTASISINEVKNKGSGWAGVSIRSTALYLYKLKVSWGGSLALHLQLFNKGTLLFDVWQRHHFILFP